MVAMRFTSLMTIILFIYHLVGKRKIQRKKYQNKEAKSFDVDLH